MAWAPWASHPSRNPKWVEKSSVDFWSSLQMLLQKAENISDGTKLNITDISWNHEGEEQLITELNQAKSITQQIEIIKKLLTKIPKKKAQFNYNSTNSKTNQANLPSIWWWDSQKQSIQSTDELAKQYAKNTKQTKNEQPPIQDTNTEKTHSTPTSDFSLGKWYEKQIISDETAKSQLQANNKKHTYTYEPTKSADIPNDFHLKGSKEEISKSMSQLSEQYIQDYVRWWWTRENANFAYTYSTYQNTIQQKIESLDIDYFSREPGNISNIKNKATLTSLLKAFEKKWEKIHAQYINKELLPNFILDTNASLANFSKHNIPQKTINSNLSALVQKIIHDNSNNSQSKSVHALTALRNHNEWQWWEEIVPYVLLRAIEWWVDAKQIATVIKKHSIDISGNQEVFDLYLKETNTISESDFGAIVNKLNSSEFDHKKLSEAEQESLTKYIFNAYKTDPQKHDTLVSQLMEKWFWWTNGEFVHLPNKWINLSATILKKGFIFADSLSGDIFKHPKIIDTIFSQNFSINSFKDGISPRIAALWDTKTTILYYKKLKEKFPDKNPEEIGKTLAPNWEITSFVHLAKEKPPTWLEKEFNELVSTVDKAWGSLLAEGYIAKDKLDNVSDDMRQQFLSDVEWKLSWVNNETKNKILTILKNKKIPSEQDINTIFTLLMKADKDTFKAHFASITTLFQEYGKKQEHTAKKAFTFKEWDSEKVNQKYILTNKEWEKEPNFENIKKSFLQTLETAKKQAREKNTRIDTDAFIDEFINKEFWGLSPDQQEKIRTLLQSSHFEKNIEDIQANGNVYAAFIEERAKWNYTQDFYNFSHDVQEGKVQLSAEHSQPWSVQNGQVIQWSDSQSLSDQPIGTIIPLTSIWEGMQNIPHIESISGEYNIRTWKGGTVDIVSKDGNQTLIKKISSEKLNAYLGYASILKTLRLDMMIPHIQKMLPIIKKQSQGNTDTIQDGKLDRMETNQFLDVIARMTGVQRDNLPLNEYITKYNNIFTTKRDIEAVILDDKKGIIKMDWTFNWLALQKKLSQ